MREIAKGIIDKRIQNNMACTNEDDKNKNDSDFLDSYLKRYLSENNLKDKEMEITREEIV